MSSHHTLCKVKIFAAFSHIHVYVAAPNLLERHFQIPLCYCHEQELQHW